MSTTGATDEGSSGTGPATTTGAVTTTDATTGSSGGSTGGPAPLCECIDWEENGCPEEQLAGCEAPVKCSELDIDEPTPATAACVLGLLRDRPLVRFRYCWSCGGYESHHGEFLIRGPELDAVDFECTRIDFSSSFLVRFHGLEPPEYFEGCLALTGAKAQTDCMLMGMHVGEQLPQCGG